MFELLILILFIRKRWICPKESVEEKTKVLSYSPGFISEKEIEDAVQEMQKYAFQAVMLIYTHILNIMKNSEEIVHFEMYGIGHIWRKQLHGNQSNGTFQLAVAFNLIKKMKKKFSEITITSQEPCHFPVEIEYLRNKNVYVFTRHTFSPDYFFNQIIPKSTVSKPIMICYMIHFSIYDFENFLDAHWTPEILSKIIFIGNWFLNSIFHEHILKCKKTKLFCEMVDCRKILPFEYPNFERIDGYYYGFDQWPPYTNHPSDFLSWKSFGRTEIMSISYENAVKLTKNII